MNELDRLCQLEEHNGLIAKCSVEGMGRRRPFSADFPFNTFFPPSLLFGNIAHYFQIRGGVRLMLHLSLDTAQEMGERKIPE